MKHAGTISVEFLEPIEPGLDKETFMITYSDLYDHNGELWKLVLMNIRTDTKPNPKADLEYDEEDLTSNGLPQGHSWCGFSGSKASPHFGHSR